MNYKTYNSYKKTNISWISQIPFEWNITKVKHCFKRKNEKAKQENPVVLSLARSGVKIRDISTGEGQLAESYYNYNPVKPGDLLLNPMDLISGANCSISHVEGVISPAYANLKSKEGINPKYYDYFFKLQYWSLAFFVHGKGVSSENRWTLNNETLMNYLIPLPDIDTQNKISGFLDKRTSEIDENIAKNKELILLLEEKKTTLINQVVTKGLDPNVPMKDSDIEWIGEIPEHWENINLKYLANLQTGTTPRNNIGINLESGINWFTPGDFNNTYKLSYSEKYIKKETIKTNNICIYPPNSILMVCIGATIGKLGVTNDISYSNQQITAILPKSSNIFYKYLLYYLISKTDYIKKTANFTTLPILNNHHLSFFKILCPQHKEQKQIADYLDKETSKTDKTISKIKENIELLEEYKTSLIHHVVTGKIDVRGEEI